MRHNFFSTFWRQSHTLQRLPMTFICISLLSLSCFAGCTSPYIRGTKIQETPRNKQVVEVLFQYERAMQKSRWKKVLLLVS
ncbi:MAG: hypothetical protein AAGJ35_11415, partial [Myxococcota bacterium]